MPFIPHNPDEVSAMLGVIGVATIEDLFDEIPPELHAGALTGIPPALSEMEISRLMTERSRQDGQPLSFLGAGAYAHHIPAAVWQLVSRGEFYSAYTPYQAEASQGTLQVLYEYQSMMTALLAMDVSNASLYDGASALAEAVLMAVRANRGSHSHRVLIPASVHPAYRQVVRTLVTAQGIELVELPYDPRGGHLDPDSLGAYAGQDFAALVVPQPNFFGIIEDADTLTDWAHAQGMLVIGLVNPLAMAILTPPGEWGVTGADIACGEGQPLGIPLSSGGPYFGFLCCKAPLVRQFPGRLVGRTLDRDGNPGFTLTLQAREQHIRRSKATSNICTNQGLMVTAATIHMALLGAEGLERVAAACHGNLRRLTEKLCTIPGVEPLFDRPVFHEQALRLPAPAGEVLRSLAGHSLLGGYDLGRDYRELEGALLICATELHNADDLDRYQEKLARVIATRTQPRCPVSPKL